jgi:hypothetical protein
VRRPLLPLLIALAWSRLAAAEPVRDRVLTAPTAWLPAAGTLVGTAGVDQRGDGDVIVGYGLGELAEVTVGGDTDVRRCDGCGGRATPLRLGRAAFRLGARPDTWFAGQPALVFGVRTTFAGPARVSEAYVVASRTLGPLRLHAGGQVTDAAADADAGTVAPRLRKTMRPLAGFEWTPAQYPRTTLLADLAWVPRFDLTGPTLEWLAGWGVRYNALAWGAIELDVRHRQGEGLGDSTVMVRLDGAWGR